MLALSTFHHLSFNGYYCHIPCIEYVFFTSQQILLSEKDQGLQRLNVSVEAGEKLYPDTAPSGRDKIRHELRTAKEAWDNLMVNLNDCQRKFDTFLMQWTSFMESQGHFVKWLSDTEAVVKNDLESRGSLQEKRSQLQNNKVS